MMTAERTIEIVAAVIVVLLQVLLAPHVAIGYAVPNFMLAFVIARSVARVGTQGSLMPFAFGLLYDLLSGGPVGAMAFTLTAVCTFASWLFNRTNNDTFFMVIVSIAVGVFCAEALDGTFYLLFGYASGVFDALAYRIVPCFVYDFVIALALYFLFTRFMRRDVPLASEINQLH